MSKTGKPEIRIVENGNSESNRSTPHSLVGIRQLPDGSLEYRADASDGAARWLPLSSPIRVLALTRDGDNRNWGRLIEVVDADGRCHRWSMPAALLASLRGDDYRQTLLSLGARLATRRAPLPMRCIAFSAPLPTSRAAICHAPGPQRDLAGTAAISCCQTVRSAAPISSSIKPSRKSEPLSARKARSRNGGSELLSQRKATRASYSPLSAAFAAPLLAPAPARRRRHPLQRRHRQSARPRR